MQLIVTICVFVLLLKHLLESRVYEPCRLAKELHYVYGIDREQIPYWMCYIDKWSAYNTSRVTEPEGMLYFGLFQFSNRFSCMDPNRPDLNGSKRCPSLCSDLTDDNIRNDVNCILNEMRDKGETNRSSFMADQTCEEHKNLNMFIYGCNI